MNQPSPRATRVTSSTRPLATFVAFLALASSIAAPRGFAQEPEEPAPSRAAPPPHAPTPEVAAPDAAAHAETPAPDAEPAPAPAAPPPAASRTTAVVAGVPIRAYGILWAQGLVTQGVQSFGMPTAVAPTSALNPALAADPDHGLLSFQVQQTRAGVAIGEGTPFHGVLEIDFVHFDQSSPTTQAFPRVRIALLEWSPNDRHRLFLGQTWDLFGNAIGPQLLSHSVNLVGTLFQAGNIGFMRHQLGWIGTFGAVELAAALGLQGANAGPTFNDIERSATPTGSARFLYRLPGTMGAFGASGIASSLRFTSAGEVERRAAMGGQLFGDLTFGPLNLHGELYLAQNLANMGALDLGQGRFGRSVADAGGYLSAKLTAGAHAVTAMFGGAAVLHPSDVVPGYTPAAAGPPAVAAAPNLAAGPGIERNLTAHVGYWYSPVRGLSIVVEPYVYATRFRLDAADVGRVAADQVSFGGSLGGLYQF